MGRLPRVVFFGTSGDFSSPSLVALLAAEVPVAAVVVPGAPAGRLAPRQGFELPVLTRAALPGLRQLAQDHCIPLLEVAHPAAAVPELTSLAADLICVACFPWRLPAALLRTARQGALNVHPSLLPAYRGPAPLFWQFRHGETTGGVTVHWMSDHLDAGEIAAQAALPIPEGIGGAEFEARCAEAGGSLLARVVRHAAAGELPRRPQDERGASYHSWPRPDDFRIHPTESVRRAFRFARAAPAWGVPAIVVGEREFPIREALAYSATARLDLPYRLEGNELAVRFSPGVLVARVMEG